MDLDCLGSMALAHYLYPDYALVRSQRIHPLAKSLYHLFQDHLPLVNLNELDLSNLEHVVVVDTRSLSQIHEYLERGLTLPAHVSVYDHHHSDGCDIPGAVTHQEALGANTSVLCHLLARENIVISPELATIALAGIVADTGSFSHNNVSSRDFSAATWLLDAGADLSIVRKGTSKYYDNALSVLMHQLAASMTRRQLRGHSVVLGEVDVENQAPGLALLVERLFEFEQAEVIVCVFNMLKEKSHLIISRSASPDLDMAFVLSAFGGGGHPQAASALLKKSNDIPVMQHLISALNIRLKPALRAQDIMHKSVNSLRVDWTMLEAAKFLEEHNHASAPVVDEHAHLLGLLSLREIQKARKADSMHAPVKAYMNRSPKTLNTQSTLQEIEDLFFSTDLGLAPVIDQGQLRGIISRADLLNLLKVNGSFP